MKHLYATGSGQGPIRGSLILGYFSTDRANQLATMCIIVPQSCSRPVSFGEDESQSIGVW